MFKTIAGVLLPDHGDLWSAEWGFEVQDGEILFEAQGKCLPYRFQRRVRLHGNSLTLTYQIANTGESEFSFLWSAHPLLAVEPGSRILLPEEVSSVVVDWSRGERLGIPGDTCGWPIARTRNEKETDLSCLSGVSAGAADKIFTDKLTTGECALIYPRTDEALIFRFDPTVIPYLGLWICQGGWPSSGNPHFTLGIEPCSGRPDSLQTSMSRRECPRLLPGQTSQWKVSIEAVSGKRDVQFQG
jgi:galactose mutarotase-like enzyme